jgi:transposase
MVLEESEPARAKAKNSTTPRREYSMAKKLQVVRETLTPGASVSVVARRHDINSNVVFRWRRMYARGELGKAGGKREKKASSRDFVSVGVVDHAGVMRALPGPKQDAALHDPMEREPAEQGLIEIETAAGVKVRVSGRVDDRTLGVVLAEIRRRP